MENGNLFKKCGWGNQLAFEEKEDRDYHHISNSKIYWDELEDMKWNHFLKLGKNINDIYLIYLNGWIL